MRRPWRELAGIPSCRSCSPILTAVRWAQRRPLLAAALRTRPRPAPTPSWGPRKSGRAGLGSDVGGVVSKAAHDSYRSAVTATWLDGAWPTKTHRGERAARRGSQTPQPHLEGQPSSPPTRKPDRRTSPSPPTRSERSHSLGQRSPANSKCFAAIAAQVRSKSQV